ncbi:histidine phosphatase family protein [Corynebacterium striatum]|uniref:histidine phosphatase family protein n=1 Tax=Corynebacterium striatum TaxID=43770 RepID=UPI001A1BA4BE|nr:histidine phosphatase family protein [Corynebacterium striatum]HAT1476591.1 histidine phosphatase family protein [Corynebacterium striatum]HAT6525965.1 histidine phosphatase family protein [Corynebacterium striatum]HAT6564045.1 histidine phosphatase family protein [Corynebacterium striatum]HAT6569449.1 histidine phosphatase family protein [Corynebacterium striatum]
MSTTIVHLVRHGEVYNPDKILYGRIPGYHLSSRGRSMAARTAEAFRGHDVTYLVASPLQRTQETAQPISKVTGLDVEIDKSVIESGNRFEGLRTKGWNSQLWNPQRWPLLRNPLQPSWGEPFEEIAARMMNAVERARQKAKGHEAIIVSHQLPIVMVQRTALGKRLAHAPWDRECDLASVTSLVFQDDQLIDIFYSSPAQAI